MSILHEKLISIWNFIKEKAGKLMLSGPDYMKKDID